MSGIAVTGIGMICSAGNTASEVLAELCQEKGMSREAWFRPSTHLKANGAQGELPLVAEVPLSDQALRDRTGLSPETLKRTSRAGLLALLAIQEALQDSGLLSMGIPADRIGIFCGTSLGGTTDLEALFREYVSTGKTRRPSLALSGAYNAMNDMVASIFQIKGSRSVVSTACSSGTVILELAKSQLESGLLDAALIYGVDPIAELSVAGFRSLGGLSKTLTSPFSEGDAGLSLGEGATAMILQNKPRADRAPYAYLSGTSVMSEAYHPTAPDPTGRGARAAMTGAMANAGVETAQVQGIFAHGTGTELNDPAETRAIQNTFGTEASQLTLLSTKGATGHTLGAAGTLNAALACLSLAAKRLPPSHGFKSPRKGCTLAISQGAGTPLSRDAAVANSFGFGGSNASAVFSRSSSEKGLSASSAEPVWITGAGVLTPFGCDAEFLDRAIQEGETRLRDHGPNPSFTGRYSISHAGTVDLAEPATAAVLRRSRNMRKLDRFSSLAFVSATQALTNSGLKVTTKNREKVGLILGTDTGPLDVLQQFYRTVVKEGIGAGNPSLFPNTVLNACLGYLNIDHLIQGPSIMVAQGEAASSLAIQSAALALTEPRLEAVLCGGVDEYSTLLEKGYLDMRHIPSGATAETGLRPFHKDSTGYLLGEASITFLLEKAQGAMARGAKAKAVLRGSLVSGEDTPGAHRYASTGANTAKLIQEAIERFGRPDLIVANGTGLRALDKVLSEGILGSCPETPVYSPAGMFGHPRGTVGALGMFAALSAVKHQTVPPMKGCQPGDGLQVNASDRAISAVIERVFVVTVSHGGYAVLNVVEKAGQA